MELIIIVINQTELLDELLAKFMEHNLSGATVIDSSGMSHLVASSFPIFSMFAELEEERTNNSKTIFKVSNSREERELTEHLLEEVFGDLDAPDTAILFTIPVNYSRGIHYF